MRASCASHTLRSFANMQQWFGGCACLQLVALTPLRRELGEIFRVGVDQLAQPLLLLRARRDLVLHCRLKLRCPRL